MTAIYIAISTTIDDGADMDDGVDTGTSVDQVEVQDVPATIGQADSEVLVDGRVGVPPICLRRGLRSQITLGEEII